MTKFVHAKRFFPFVLAIQFALAAMHTECVSADTLDEQLYAAGSRVYEEGLSREVKERRLEHFENVCNELLGQFTEPEEQARIYILLAGTYAQTGQLRPAKTIQYAKKAVEYPITSLQKVQLYIYWGDATSVAGAGVRGEDRAAARRKAVRPYLTGLKETLQYNLPEVSPELPRVDTFLGRGDPDTERRFEAEHERQMEARRLAVFQHRMIILRDGLTNQIVSIYSLKPFATDELRQMATEILEDTDAVEKLISKVDAVVKEKLQKELGEISEEVFRELSAGALKDVTPEELPPKSEIPEIPAEKEVQTRVETEAAGQSEAEPLPETSGLSPVILIVAAVIVLAAAILIFWVKRVRSANK